MSEVNGYVRIEQFNDAFKPGSGVLWYDDEGIQHYSKTNGPAYMLCGMPVVSLSDTGNYSLNRVAPVDAA